MHRFLTIALPTLLSLVIAASAAWADSYELVNNSGNTLKVQSKAIKFVPPTEVKPAFFELAAGATKLVEFGNDFRIWFAHLYNAANTNEYYEWGRKPQPTDPDRNWRIEVSPGIKVTITEK